MVGEYYTPEMEEFHIGFEYETTYLQDYDTWKKEIIEEDDAGYFHSIYFGDAVPTEFRVKYLDKEDIESLGFNKRNISRSEWSKTIDGQIFTIHEFWTYNQSERENLIRITSGKENNFPYRIKFEGDIKNKSELKRLLKQLNIK